MSTDTSAGTTAGTPAGNSAGTPAGNPAPRRLKVTPDTAVVLVLVLALVLLAAYFTAQNSTFLAFSNAMLLMQNGSALAVVAVPLALLMINGKVDLSIGSTVALSSTLVALCLTEWGIGPAGAIAVGVAAGTAIGAVNGLLCAVLGFNPIIATLGMLGIVRGATMLTHDGDIYLGSVPFFQVMGTATFAGVPLLVWVVAAVFAVGGAFIALTPWGRYTYAIGANRDAAFLSGLSVRALPFVLYVASGAAAGLSGVMLTARINGASPGSSGLSMEMDALTVVLLGGVAFAGGRGRLTGVLVAWVFLAALQNGLILTNVTPNIQKVASGAALVAAAALDAFITLAWPRLVRARETRKRLSAQGPVPTEKTGAPR